MILVDANVLIYSVNETAPHHETTKSWLVNELSSGRPVGIPWACVLAFIRIVTNPRVFAEPLDVDQALAVVNGWLALPNVSTPEPGPRHLNILTRLLTSAGTAGNLTTDAHLAALTIERGGSLATFDRDLARFDVPVVIPGG